MSCRLILKVGQQSLPIFITSMFLARLMGWALDQMGRDLATMWLVNLSGAAILVITAYSVGWIKIPAVEKAKGGGGNA